MQKLIMAFLLHYDYEEATTLEHSTFNTASIKLLNHPLFVFYDLSAEIQTNVTQRQSLPFIINVAASHSDSSLVSTSTKYAHIFWHSSYLF